MTSMTDLSDFERGFSARIAEHTHTDPDLQRFERSAKARIAEHLDPTLKKKRATTPAIAERKGIKVTLAVRHKRLSMDTLYTHQSTSISRLEATIEAEHAARRDGWPIIGHVVEWEDD